MQHFIDIQWHLSDMKCDDGQELSKNDAYNFFFLWQLPLGYFSISNYFATFVVLLFYTSREQRNMSILNGISTPLSYIHPMQLFPLALSLLCYECICHVQTTKLTYLWPLYSHSTNCYI